MAILKVAGNVRAWVLALLIFIVFFCASAISGYHSVHILGDNSKSISHTLNVLNLIEELKVNLFKAESSQRGYLITDDQKYSAPYEKSIERLSYLLNTLSNMTTEIEGQKERFTELYGAISEKIKEMSKTISYVDQNRDSSATRLVKSDKGHDLSLIILDLVGEMEAAEHELLSELRIAEQQQKERFIWRLIATNIVGLVLSLAMFYAIFRHSTRVQNLNAQIQQQNSDLETKVIERTSVLQHYADELERSNKELEDFAFVASHDLQEPLRKIRAFGDRLLTKFSPELGEQGQDYIRRMQLASTRMSQLIEDLLAFSRVTTQQKPFAIVDLNKVLSDITQDLEHAINEREAKITISDLPEIDGDESQLRQVFANLLSNSLKFTEAGKTPEITIQAKDVATDERADLVAITFKDNGIGFDEQYKERIFNLFQRLHGKGEYPGTGIGLALCKKIISRHNGEISVESQLGVGTEFTLLLPREQTSPTKQDVENLL